MIISRTPFRISFVGGGTDLKVFYRRTYGAVTSASIDKYMYITVNRLPSYFNYRIRVSYSQTENVKTVKEIRHPIVRESLKMVGVNGGVEIHSMADIPSRTGLGSSSSFTVGLLNALHAFKGEYASAEQLAREACAIEIDILREPIGKQDQYIAAYGGLNYIRFNPDETVYVDPIICSPETRGALFGNMMVFFTGWSRPASSVLKEQKKITASKIEVLTKMRDLTKDLNSVLSSGKKLDRFGQILQENWMLKRELVHGISNPEIDVYYEKARRAGALGGKILGAGGGGFLLFYVEKKNQNRVRQALGGLMEVKINFEPQGSKIIYVGG
ncbi:MAG: GHMP kinase [Candidatus Aureabacteria bacterium]|nr:GHMP kinase [Candidatus Auribacterota bacterium]